jgi:hypothetical protein
LDSCTTRAEGGQLSLVVAVALERGDAHQASATRSMQLEARPDTYTTSGIVAAMSHLLGQLADAVADLLRSG